MNNENQEVKNISNDFNRYVAVQKSGITNMFDVNMVCNLSGLTREQVIDIMKNYTKYSERYKIVAS